MFEGEEVKILSREAVGAPEYPALLGALLGPRSVRRAGRIRPAAAARGVDARAQARRNAARRPGGERRVARVDRAADQVRRRAAVHRAQRPAARRRRRARRGPGRHRPRGGRDRRPDGGGRRDAHQRPLRAPGLRREDRPPGRPAASRAGLGHGADRRQPPGRAGPAAARAARATSRPRSSRRTSSDALALVASQDGRFTVFAWCATRRAWSTPTASRRCCCRRAILRRGVRGPARSPLRRGAGRRPLARVRSAARGARGARPGIRALAAARGGRGARGRPLRRGLSSPTRRPRRSASRRARPTPTARRSPGSVYSTRRARSPFPPAPAGPPPEVSWRPALDATAHASRLARIHERIAAGDTYQVNFTFPLDAPLAGGAGGAASRASLAAQRPRHAAYLDLGALRDRVGLARALLRAQRGPAARRPMKGTAPRGSTAERGRGARRRRCAARRRSAPRT